jgi:plasmid maintenance system killer protein
LWSARVNDDWRFYFTIDGDTYTLHEIQPHPK